MGLARPCNEQYFGPIGQLLAARLNEAINRRSFTLAREILGQVNEMHGLGKRRSFYDYLSGEARALVTYRSSTDHLYFNGIP
jgi:hypothetical protein